MLLLVLVGLLLKCCTLAAPTTDSTTSALDKRFISWRNDLIDHPCRRVTVIFARGTAELGNVGLFAGPPFFDELAKSIGSRNLAVQGVGYPATVLGYLAGGDRNGAKELARLTKLAAKKCPKTKIVLSGYSQGAQLVHLGARTLSKKVVKRVKSVVLFGDPDEGDPISHIATAKIDTICFKTDVICDGIPVVGLPHLAYGTKARQAAKFVTRHLRR